MVDEAVVDRHLAPAPGAVEAERGIAQPPLTGDDVELAAPAVAPGVGHRMQPRLGRRHAGAPQGVHDHLALEQQLALMADVLELASAALGDVGAGRRHPIRGRLAHALDAAEPGPPLAEGEDHLDQLVRDAAVDHQGGAVRVGEAETAVDHPLAADDAPGTAPERGDLRGRDAHGEGC